MSEEKMNAVSECIFRGEKIAAIKLYREMTGLGLAEAKGEVEAIEAKLRQQVPERFTAPASSGGCLGMAAALMLSGVPVVCWLLLK
jgi:hypothetical protein